MSWNNADEVPEGIRNISISASLATAVTVRSYVLADLQSVTGQVVAPEGVFQVIKQNPVRGELTLVMAKVNSADMTSEERHYGLGGTVDATLVESSGTSSVTYSVHIDF